MKSIKGSSKQGLAIFCLVSLFSVATPVSVNAADDHGTDHHSGSSGHTGGGKGPKYMGGQKGESHSHEGHTGGPHQGGPSRGGSKHTEDKIFHGHEDHEGGEMEATAETEATIE